MVGGKDFVFLGTKYLDTFLSQWGWVGEWVGRGGMQMVSQREGQEYC